MMVSASSTTSDDVKRLRQHVLAISSGSAAAQD